MLFDLKNSKIARIVTHYGHCIDTE